MSLIEYKLLTAALIALITIWVGFAALRVIRKDKQFLQIGDALADGIFIGVAVFHLLPTAIDSLRPLWHISSVYLIVFLCLMGGFALLFILERSLIHQEDVHEDAPSICHASAWMLAGILSVHAFIEGVALGISNEIHIVTVLLIAILAHKGFESYALVMGLHRNLQNERLTKTILLVFTFVTPIGILIASLIEDHLQNNTTSLIMGLFSAFAAGSFLYIGTLHSTHTHFHPERDKSHRALTILLTLFGFIAMGVIAIWV